MNSRNAITSEPINELLSKRWSSRAYDKNKPVSRKDIISICEAGRWAPSCFGDEPWRFMVWDIFHDKKSYLKAFSSIGGWNRRWVRNAPVIILSLSDNIFRKNNEFNRWGQHDTGLATQNIILQSFSLGLIAHPLGGFDKNKVKKDFNIPERFEAMAFIAIGYPAENNVLDPDHLKDETKPRFRKPLGDNFFDGKWEKPII